MEAICVEINVDSRREDVLLALIGEGAWGFGCAFRYRHYRGVEAEDLKLCLCQNSVQNDYDGTNHHA